MKGIYILFRVILALCLVPPVSILIGLLELLKLNEVAKEFIGLYDWLTNIK
uniref:hypothetical protein n=1 Tax=Flavobacterium sp. TaxID=239 RepID=UPI0040488E65